MLHRIFSRSPEYRITTYGRNGEVGSEMTSCFDSHGDALTRAREMLAESPGASRARVRCRSGLTFEIRRSDEPGRPPRR